MSDFKLDGLDHVAITVRDLDRSIAWYQDKLGLKRVHADAWGGVPTFMVAGSTGLALFPVREDAIQPPTGPNTISIRHIAFRATRLEFDKSRSVLKSKGVEIHFQDHEISHSIYFNDPDGHELEITTYDV